MNAPRSGLYTSARNGTSMMKIRVGVTGAMKPPIAPQTRFHQSKAAVPAGSTSLQRKAGTVAPPAYRPTHQAIAVPAAYRPGAGVPVQRQVAAGPAVYRPANSATPVPAAYRPKAIPGVNHATLQRKLVVTGQPEWVEEQLQELVGTHATVIVKDDRSVGLIALARDTSPAVRLLTRLIESPRTVKISPHDLSKGAVNRPESKDDAFDPTKGTGSEIEIGKGTQKSIVVVNGKLVEEDTPAWLILGHELIHADRAARGVKAKGMVDYKVSGKWKGEQISGSHLARTEEAETVGLTGAHDITENAIRTYHQLPLVAIYETEFTKWVETQKGRKDKKQPLALV